MVFIWTLRNWKKIKIVETEVCPDHVSEPFYGVSIIVEGMMMGVGKTKAPFLYNITGMWCVRIVGAMICIRFLEMGLVSAWACMIAHNMLLFCLYLGTFIRGSWNPLNVEQS